MSKADSEFELKKVILMKKTSLLTYLAAASLPLAVVTPALAQFQVNTGNALDANNQGGSFGSNTRVSPYTMPQPLYNGNQVVTGNVTQGREFRGRVGYTDPNALRTNTAGQGLDSFNRNSVGVPAPYQQTAPAYVAPRAFLGRAEAARAPQGSTYNNYAGAYVTQVPQRPTLSNSTQVNVPPADGLNPRDIGLAPPRRPDVPVSGAPLYTSQPLYTPSVNDQYGPAGYGNYRQFRSADSLRLSDQALDQMRMELNQSLNPALGAQQQQPPTVPGQPAPQPEAIGLTPQALSTPSLSATAVGSAPTGAISNEPLSNRLGGPLPGVAGGTEAIIPAARQSSQYAQLQQRLNQLEGQPGRTRSGAGASGGTAGVRGTAPGQPTGQTPGALAGTGGNGGRPVRGTDQGADRGSPLAERGEGGAAYAPTVPRAVAPLDVRSLAAGVQAKGLRDLLVDAERLTKDGKFAAAMERYDAAEAVAPNNPLVSLGRAHAQLGAGYYTRAERDLRAALSQDRALLMGRYDLDYFLGESRLAAVVQDLKEIANTEKDDVRSPFLLAYIAYNTKNPERAAEYLNLAERRAGAPDPFLKLLRAHWELPKGDSAGDAKKPEAK